MIAHAVKVPGLIFLSGQTPVNKEGKVVDGGIAEHTVGSPLHILCSFTNEPNVTTGPVHQELDQRVECCRLFLGKGSQSQRVPQEYGRLCRDEQGL